MKNTRFFDPVDLIKTGGRLLKKVQYSRFVVVTIFVVSTSRFTLKYVIIVTVGNKDMENRRVF